MTAPPRNASPSRAGRPIPAPLLLAAVLALQGLAVALVGAGGDFPVSDDWAYGHVVRALGEGRGFDFLPWTGATLVLQALAGAAACAVAGTFSWEVLRATTLAASAAGVALLFLLVRRLGADARVAAAAAAGLALSPLWFHLSFTFMTEVPFAALVTASLWAYARGFDRHGATSRGWLLAASAAVAAAFLVRQQAVPVAAAAALVALMPFAARAPLARVVDAACAAALPALVTLGWIAWVMTSDAVPPAVHNKVREASAVSPLVVADVAMRAAATLGFLFLPWATTLKAGRDYPRAAALSLGAALAAAALVLWARSGTTMFYLPNVMDEWTLGALTTRDTQFLGHHHDQTTALAPRALLTAVSIASAAVLGAVLLRALLPGRGVAANDTRTGVADEDFAGVHRAAGDDAAGRRLALFFALALLLSGAASLLQARYYFDRYAIAFLPLAVAATVVAAPRARPGAAFAAAWAALALYAVAGTHDYMAWNRARWDLLGTLEARGVAPTSIDGGFEYNADRLAAKLGTAPTDAEARRGQDESRRSWWWVVDDEWVIAFRPLGGYAVADTREYARWLPPGRGRVLALRRESGEAPR